MIRQHLVSRIYVFVLLITLFFSFHRCAGIVPNDSEIAVNAIKKIAVVAVITTLSTIVHEWGHASTAMCLFKPQEMPQIHIGTTTPAKDRHNLLFSLGNMHFYKHLWNHGVTCFQYSPHDPQIHYKLGVITIAGGISAAIFLFSILTAIITYCDHCDGNGVLQSMITSPWCALSPFSHIANTRNLPVQQKDFLLQISLTICTALWFNLFYGCTPILPGDGTELWQTHIGLSNDKLFALQIVSSIAAGICGFFVMQQYYRASRQAFHHS